MFVVGLWLYRYPFNEKRENDLDDFSLAFGFVYFREQENTTRFGNFKITKRKK